MTLTDNDTPKSSWLQIKNQNNAKSIHYPPTTNLNFTSKSPTSNIKTTTTFSPLFSIHLKLQLSILDVPLSKCLSSPRLVSRPSRATGLRATSSPFSSIEVPFLPQSVRFAYSLFFSSNPLQHFHLSVQPVHHFLHFHFFLIMFHLQNSVSSTKPIFIFHPSNAMLFVLVWCGLSSLFHVCPLFVLEWSHSSVSPLS